MPLETPEAGIHDPEGGVFKTVLLKVVTDAIYIAFFICNHDVGKVTKSLVKDIIRQIVPTAYQLGTSYWVFYILTDHYPKTLCFCSRLNIKCRHSYLQRWHCIDVDEKLAEDSPLFGSKHAGIVQPLISKLRIAFTERSSIVIDFDLSPIDYVKANNESAEIIPNIFPSLHIKLKPQSIPPLRATLPRNLSPLGCFEGFCSDSSIHENSTINSSISITNSFHHKNYSDSVIQGLETLAKNLTISVRHPCEPPIQNSLALEYPEGKPSLSINHHSQLSISPLKTLEGQSSQFHPLVIPSVSADPQIVPQVVAQCYRNSDTIDGCQDCNVHRNIFANHNLVNNSIVQPIQEEIQQQHQHSPRQPVYSQHFTCVGRTGSCNICPRDSQPLIENPEQIPRLTEPLNVLIPQLTPIERTSLALQAQQNLVQFPNYSYSSQQILPTSHIQHRPPRHQSQPSPVSTIPIPQVRTRGLSPRPQQPQPILKIKSPTSIFGNTRQPQVRFTPPPTPSPTPTPSPNPIDEDRRIQEIIFGKGKVESKPEEKVCEIEPLVQISIPEIIPSLKPVPKAEVSPTNLSPTVHFRLEYVLKLPKVKSYKTIVFIPSPKSLFPITSYNNRVINTPITKETLPSTNTDSPPHNPPVHIIADLRFGIVRSFCTDTCINHRRPGLIDFVCTCEVCANSKLIEIPCNCRFCSASKQACRSTQTSSTEDC